MWEMQVLPGWDIVAVRQVKSRFATAEPPHAYRIFRDKEDNFITVVLNP
jgi:hypothetical protein